MLTCLKAKTSDKKDHPPCAQFSDTAACVGHTLRTRFQALKLTNWLFWQHLTLTQNVWVTESVWVYEFLKIFLTFWLLWIHNRPNPYITPTRLKTVQHSITMIDGRTVFGQTLLTIFFFETKSNLHCSHFPFFAYTSSNTVHTSFVTVAGGPDKPVML
jgi:hypothetical protein